MSNQDGERKGNPLGICAGLAVIVITFFGGFIFMMSNIRDLGIGQILFFMMVVPMIGFFVGFAIIIKTNPGSGFAGGLFGGSFFRHRYGLATQTVEKNYIHEPPAFCSSYGGSITSENIEWVGPLSVKCPYCAATLPTSKREI